MSSSLVPGRRGTRANSTAALHQTPAHEQQQQQARTKLTKTASTKTGQRQLGASRSSTSTTTTLPQKLKVLCRPSPHLLLLRARFSSSVSAQQRAHAAVGSSGTLVPENLPFQNNSSSSSFTASCSSSVATALYSPQPFIYRSHKVQQAYYSNSGRAGHCRTGNNLPRAQISRSFSTRAGSRESSRTKLFLKRSNSTVSAPPAVYGGRGSHSKYLGQIFGRSDHSSSNRSVDNKRNFCGEQVAPFPSGCSFRESLRGSGDSKYRHGGLTKGAQKIRVDKQNWYDTISASNGLHPQLGTWPQSARKSLVPRRSHTPSCSAPVSVSGSEDSLNALPGTGAPPNLCPQQQESGAVDGVASLTKSCSDLLGQSRHQLSLSNRLGSQQERDEANSGDLGAREKVSLHVLRRRGGKKRFIYRLKGLGGFSKSMDIMEGSRRIMKIKTKKPNFRKQHLKLFRDSEPLIAVLSWGVNQSIQELQNVPIPPIFMSSDYKAHWKIKKENHNFNKKNMPSHFKFKEYCPLIFKKLRQIFNYSDERFLETLYQATPEAGGPSTDPNCLSDEDAQENDGSLPSSAIPSQFPNPQDPLSNVDPNAASAGPAPSINPDCDLYPQLPLLHYSRDRSLVIKFISSENVAEMHNFLPKYYRHIVERGNTTLLPRYLAMYRLSTSSSSTSSSEAFDKHGKGYYCVVMENMFSRKLKIHCQYDLKGSTIGRQASDRERRNGLLFDKDFIQGGQKIILEKETRRKFLDRLHSDVNFLSEFKIISYSLLLGIHDRNREDSMIRRAQNLSGGSPVDPNSSDKGYESPDNQLTPGDRVGDASINPDDGQSTNTVTATTEQIRRISVMDSDICNYEFPALNANEYIYYMGLIDCMSDYDTQKRVAHAVKSAKHGSNADISTVKPEKYKTRFLEFVENSVVIEGSTAPVSAATTSAST